MARVAEKKVAELEKTVAEYISRYESVLRGREKLAEYQKQVAAKKQEAAQTQTSVQNQEAVQNQPQVQTKEQQSKSTQATEQTTEATKPTEETGQQKVEPKKKRKATNVVKKAVPKLSVASDEEAENTLDEILSDPKKLVEASARAFGDRPTEQDVVSTFSQLKDYRRIVTDGRKSDADMSVLADAIKLASKGEKVNVEPTQEAPSYSIATKESFTKDGIKDLPKLRGWAVLTAEDPNNQKASDEYNKAAMESLRAWLKEEGVDYVDVVGKYDTIQNSVAVFGEKVDDKFAERARKKFEQQSVLIPEGLLYENGVLDPATGESSAAPDADNYYTILPDGTKWQYGIDFENRTTLDEFRKNPKFSLSEDEEDDGLETPEEKRRIFNAALKISSKLKYKPIEEYSPAAARQLVKRIRKIIDAELATGNGAEHWYRDDLARALWAAAAAYPEIKTNPEARDAFIAALAITSNGLTIDKNVEAAIEVFEGWKETGRLPQLEFGVRGKMIARTLGIYNMLIDELGFEGAQEFLSSKMTVKEMLISATGVTGSTKMPMGMEVYGSAIFGPKIGYGFYSNLSGRLDALTGDMWFWRTWGRITNTLIRKKGSGEQVLAENKLRASEREFAQYVMEKVVDEYRAEGKDLTVADAQAILWYAEKRLYDSLGAAYENAKPTSYSVEVERWLDTNKPGWRANAGPEPRGGRALGERVQTGSTQEATRIDQGPEEGIPFSLSAGPSEPTVRSGRGGRPDSVEVTGIHYGRAKVPALSGSFFGRGIKGEEQRRVAASTDPRIKRRIYFYIAEGSGRPPVPEEGLGPWVYRAKIGNLWEAGVSQPLTYDTKSRDGWPVSQGELLNRFESAVLDAGYDGYVNRERGVAVVMNKDVPVELIGNRAEGPVKFSLSGDTIEVDGKVRQRRNSEGMLIHPTEEGIRNFWKWFGDSVVVDDEGRPIVLYHGTTYDFYEFKSSKLSPSSNMGKGFYLSNNVEDVNENYASEAGPDLRMKINIALDEEAYKRGVNVEDLPKSVVRRIESRYIKHGGVIMPAYVRMVNPAVIGGPEETVFSSDQNSKLSVKRLVHNIIEASGRFRTSPNLYGALTYLLPVDRDIPLSEVTRTLFNNSDYRYVFDRNGNPVPGEVLRLALQKMGFDGVIDHTVSEKFLAMAGVSGGTTHYIAFKPEQIKSALGNVGTFNPADRRITFSLDGADDEIGSAPERSPVTVSENLAESIGKDVDGYRMAADLDRGKPVLQSVGRRWLEIAGNRAIFSYGDSFETTLDGVLKDMGGDKVKFVSERDPNETEKSIYKKYGLDVQKVYALYAGGKKVNVYETDDNKVIANLSLVDRGSGVGSVVYQAVGTWASNSGKQFIGDPVGLTTSALFRRTVAMFSNALRVGSTSHLVLHRDQFAAGLTWEKGDDEYNIGSMAAWIRDTLAMYAPQKYDPEFDQNNLYNHLGGFRPSAAVDQDTLGGGEKTRAQVSITDTILKDAEVSAADTPTVLYSLDESPFYSELLKRVQETQTKVAPPAGWKSFLNSLVNKGLAKKDEIEWSGINEWLDMQGPKVTKDEVIGYLANNGVKVGEVVKTDDSETRYRTYRLLGHSGRNYTELLLKLPNQRSKYDEESFLRSNPKPSDEEATKLDVANLEWKFRKLNNFITNPHWEEPNVLAHIRFDEVETGGQYGLKQMMHVFEIQSDWAQLGRKRGMSDIDKKDYSFIDDEFRKARDKYEITRDYYKDEFRDWWRMSDKWHSISDSISGNISKEDFDLLDRFFSDEDEIVVKAEEKGRIIDALKKAARAQYKAGLSPTPLSAFEDYHIQANASLTPSSMLADYYLIDKKSDRAILYGNDIKELENEIATTAVTESVNRAIEGGFANDLPAAPFVSRRVGDKFEPYTESWVSLALKRILVYAARKGYDAVGIADGRSVAAIYNFGQRVKSITVQKVNQQDEKNQSEKQYLVWYEDRRGNSHRIIENLSRNELENYIGKTLAERALEKLDAGERSARFEGDDLKIDNKGLVRFYDEVVPNILRRVLKRFGAGELKTGEIPLNEELHGENSFSGTYVEITPELKEKLSGGAPLFSISEGKIDIDLNGLRAAINDRLRDGKKFGWWDRTVGTDYHKATKDADFKRTFDLTQRFLDDVSGIASRVADQAPLILPKMKHWTDAFRGAKDDFTGKKKSDLVAVSHAIFAGTLAGETPMDGKVWTDKELREMGLNDRQIEMYRQTRRAIDASLDQLATSEMVRITSNMGIDDAREAVRELPPQAAAEWLIGALDSSDAVSDDVKEQVAKILREKASRVEMMKAKGYAPLMRFGEYALEFEVDGEYNFMLFESNAERMRVAREMAAAGATNIRTSIMSRRGYELFRGLDLNSLEVFGDIADLDYVDEKGNVVTMKLADDELFQAFVKAATSNRSTLRRLLKRKGIPGYDTDIQRVLASFITSNARMSSANYNMKDLVESAASIDKMKGDVRDEAIKLVNYVRDPKEESSKIRGLMFANYLGGSVASAAVNLTQVPMMSYIYLSQWGFSRAASEIKAAAKVALSKKEPGGELGEALKQASEKGIVEPHEIHMLYAEASRNFGSDIRVRRFMTVWGSMFSAAEAFNRRVTFVAAYNIGSQLTDEQLREAGVESAYDFAVKAVHETQGIYNKGNRPNWARGPIGAPLFTFKQYSIMYLELLRRLPRPQQLAMLGMLVFMSGLSGLPFADDIDDLIDTIGQWLGYNTHMKLWKQKVLTDMLGKDVARFVLFGASAIPGVPLDIQGRLSMGNLIPASDILKLSNTDRLKSAVEVAGAPGGFVQQVLRGVSAVGSGGVSEGVKEFAPVAVKNFLQGVDMLQTGMYRDYLGRQVVKTDTYDAIAKIIGFQPSVVADESRRSRAVQEMVTLVRERESQIAHKWAEGMFLHDNGMVREAMDELRAWNERNPDLRIRITPEQIRRRVKEMSLTREQRVAKSAPKEIRSTVRRELGL
jgi:hypothetical protein